MTPRFQKLFESILSEAPPGMGPPTVPGEGPDMERLDKLASGRVDEPDEGDEEKVDPSKPEYQPKNLTGQQIIAGYKKWCSDKLELEPHNAVKGNEELGIDIEGPLRLKQVAKDSATELGATFGTVTGNVDLRDAKKLQHLEGFPKHVNGEWIDLRGTPISAEEILAAIPKDFTGKVIVDPRLEGMIPSKNR